MYRTFVAFAALLWIPTAAFAERPPLDVSADRRPPEHVREQLARARADAVLSRFAKPAHLDERYGVPSFVWALRDERARGAAPPTASTASASIPPEQAARGHLTRLASWYRLDAEDVRVARVRDVHDTGEGGIIVALDQVVDGMEVFRDEVRILMDRDRELLAIAGSLPGRGVAGPASRRAFGLGAPEAIARALEDFAETGAAPSVRPTGSGEGGYEFFVANGKVGSHDVEPIRAKRVLFRLPDELVPAWYVEVIAEHDASSYVVSARDGELLFRHSLMAADSYSYRVWADGTGLKAPYDGPQGTTTSPHPTGVPDFFAPAFVPPTLVSLQNGPISTNDPWLPPGATVTTGNNVDAYADLAGPDGFTAGDLRGATTAPGVFGHLYDTSLAPDASASQRMAGATQLFYVNNWLHDWFYDAGFTETAGNAQASNFGRGGVQGDRLHAQSQDYSSTNNADMTTPADGASPRMQMYSYFHSPLPHLTVNQPASIAGTKTAGLGAFSPQTLSLTANVALPNPNGFGISSTSTVGCGTGPQWVAIARLDGDAHADLVTANHATNDVSVIRANGAGGYLPKVDYAMGAGPYGVEARDLNHDGILDLICANFIAGTFSVRLGTGGGAFGAKTDFPSGSGTAVATVGRFNADAHEDVVTANYYGNTVSVFPGNGTGGFGARVDYPTGTNPNWVAVGDVNNDGHSDLVTANYGTTTISVLLGNGAGGFSPKTDFTVGGSPLTVAVADLNGDAWGDIVTANASTNTLSVLLGNGIGGYGVTNHAVPATPVTVVVSDVNADGINDVAVCSDASNSVSLLTGVGNGTLRAPVTTPVGTTPYGLAIGDVNGDGHLDLLSANFASNDVTILSGQVTPVAQWPPFTNKAPGRILLVDDFDYIWTLDMVLSEARFVAQGAGVVLMNPGASTADISTQSSYFNFPFLRVSQTDGAAMRNALRSGRVNLTMGSTAAIRRDGALDNQIVAHEWGHYLSGRLVGNAAGLTNPQGGGMGEGWSDFVNLLLVVRPEDASVVPGPLFGGTYNAGSYAIDSPLRPDNAYYFSVRRYPYSTDFARSPLTFRHIQEGEPLPAGPPVNGSLSGAGNSGVHGTGEVWCGMLWECYAELLRATGRLSFTQARDRMRSYLVASLKMTPNAPTLIEARDALLAAALANDPADHAAFCAGFARRGMGSSATGPDRFAGGNLGVLESYGCGGIQILGATLDPEYQGCDADGVTDVGERGRVLVRFRNTGQALANVSVGIACSSPNVTYPNGSMQPVASLGVGQVDSVAIVYAVTTNVGVENAEITPRANDPFQGLQSGFPLPVVFNRDNVGTSLANLADLTGWTNAGWQAGTYAVPPRTQWMSLNAMGPREDILTTPRFVPATDEVTISLTHFHWYQETPAHKDGMVVELSTDDGATWTDIGASAIAYGYNGTIASSLNPLAGRPAFVGAAPDLSFQFTTLQPVGSFAGKSCRFRMRSGYDETMVGDAYGAVLRRLEILLAAGSTLPFPAWGDETGPCTPVDVDPIVASGPLSFTLRGANPVRGSASFAFDLPRPSPVTLDVFDVKGRRIARLAEGTLGAGPHEARWNAPGAPGVYFARLSALGETRLIRTIVTH